MCSTCLFDLKDTHSAGLVSNNGCKTTFCLFTRELYEIPLSLLTSSHHHFLYQLLLAFH